MAEMVGSALFQEGVSRVVSFVLGKREEKASQAHMMEKLKMAAIDLGHALERSRKLPITDVSLLQKRKMIKCAYVEAKQLLDEQEEQEVPAGSHQVQQEELAQGLKRKISWFMVRADKKKLSMSSSVSLLSMDEVGRFEWFAKRAAEFVRDVESGCSLWHNNFFNPIVRHLLQGKTYRYQMKQEDQLGDVYILSWRSEERGTEAMLQYRYGDWGIMEENYFGFQLILRLSESTDIVGIAIKGLQILASQFNLGDQSAVGKLTLLPNLLQDIAPSFMPCTVDYAPWDAMWWAKTCRPDPVCCGCGASRHSNVSPELSHIFPEEVIFFGLDCYIISTVEPSRSHNSSVEVDRSISGRSWTSAPLAVRVGILPHRYPLMLEPSWAIVSTGDIEERRDASLQQVSEMLKSDAINGFLRQPELTKYIMDWYTTHGGAWFVVRKPRIERTRRRRYNTRGSTRPSAIRI